MCSVNVDLPYIIHAGSLLYELHVLSYFARCYKSLHVYTAPQKSNLHRYCATDNQPCWGDPSLPTSAAHLPSHLLVPRVVLHFFLHHRSDSGHGNENRTVLVPRLKIVWARLAHVEMEVKAHVLHEFQPVPVISGLPAGDLEVGSEAVMHAKVKVL